MRVEKSSCADRKQVLHASGFSMLEILAALVVLTIVAVGILGVMTYAKRSSAMMQQKMVAIHLIDKMLADIKKEDARSLSVGVEDVKAVPELRHGGMIRTVESLESDPNLKQVTIQIAWDHPWKTGAEVPCTMPQCDKQETVTTVFYEG